VSVEACGPEVLQPGDCLRLVIEEFDSRQKGGWNARSAIRNPKRRMAKKSKPPQERAVIPNARSLIGCVLLPF
jgi:hypothetical protein